MSAHEELLAAVKYVRDRTGDPTSWQTGLAPAEVAAVVTPTTRPAELNAILRKIRQQHSDLFGTGGAPAASPSNAASPPSNEDNGEAAEAIAHAEAGLAQQNSASSQLDMQVISAILNAHLKTVEGAAALTRLQRETEAAVRTRSDLDTPAGARDFQRFLIGKLRDIRAVVLNGSLDDTSKSALMAAWTSLYDASKGEPNASGEPPSAPPTGGDAPARGATQQPAGDPESGWDPVLDSLLADDPGLLPDEAAEPGPAEGAPAMPMTPVMPTIPNFGAGPLPGLGTLPGSMAGWSAPGGLPLPGLAGGNETDPVLREVDDGGLPGPRDADPNAHASPDEAGNDAGDADKDTSAGEPESSAPAPTTVTLPDGETVTAPNPQLAAAIKAAVGGAPIAEAFQQQGITIPPPGTAVPEPVDPLQVTPGDIGIFTDRHALALAPGKALLDGQMQHIAAASGPSFLGWEHPPAATATGAAPATPDTPTPTRPASSSTT